MRGREPYLHGLRLWRRDSRSWTMEMQALVVMVAAITLLTTLLDFSDRIVPRLSESPVPLGTWAQQWTTGMQPPSSEQAVLVGKLSETAGLLAGLLGLLAAGTLAGACAQRGRTHRTRRRVAWCLGADHRQMLIERAGESTVLFIVGIASAFIAAVLLPLAVVRTFPGNLHAGNGPGLFLAAGMVILAGAYVAYERSAIRDAHRLKTPFRPLATTLQSPAFLVALGFAVASSAGILLVHAEDSHTLGAPVDGVEVLRASVLPSVAADRVSVLREWLSSLESEHRVGVASAGTLRGAGVRDIAWIDCGACSAGGLPAPIKVVRPELYAVGPDTFPYLGVEIIEGHTFEAWTGSADAERAVIVSRRLARGHFEGGRALGRRVRIGGLEEEWSTVIGVVSDRSDATGDDDFAVYLPVDRAAPRELELIAGIQTKTLKRLEATVPAGVDLGGRWPGRSEYAGRRWFAVVFGLLAGVGSALIVSGGRRAAVRDARIHGPEVALRRALGARRSHVMRFFVYRVGLQVAVGLLIGAFLAIGFGAKLQGAAGDLPLIDARVWLLSGLFVVGAALTGFRAELRRTLREVPVEGLVGGAR